MVGEVVAGEGVDEIDVAGDVGDGDGDDLAVPGRRRDARRRAGASRSRSGANRAAETKVVTSLLAWALLDDRGDGGGVADRELVDQVVGFGGHGCSIDASR